MELSGTTSPRCLLRIALLRASVIILEMQEERMKEFSGTFVFLYTDSIQDVGWALKLLSEPP